MAIQDTIVVSFNESDVDYIAVVEIDDVLNVDSEGESKTSFAPGEKIYLWLHLSDNVTLDEVVCTDGSISSIGSDSREKTTQVLFSSRDADEPTEHTSDVIPTSTSLTFYGREGSLDSSYSEEGVVTLTPSSTDEVPFLVDVTHTFSVQLFELVKSNFELEEDETYPIGVVFYLKRNGE